MSEADVLYIVARRALLDALDALGAHRSALVLVGAQAIYLHTGQGDLAVAVHTTDADLVVEPGALGHTPKIGDVMREAGFERGVQVGSWVCNRDIGPKQVAVPVDLLVPEAVGGPGRRGARLGEHGKDVARKARGLEPTLSDNRLTTVGALEDVDARRFEIRVAGPSALLVAKLHKLAERTVEPRGERLKNKDALDVLRLLRAVPLPTFTEGLTRLRAEELSAAVTREAMTFLEHLFGSPSSPGSRLAISATAGLEDPVTIGNSCAVLAVELLDSLR
jgi:hypothetical protein